jgi:hypothetical protein
MEYQQIRQKIKKMEKQHPTASTPIHDNLATADFVTQPLVSPIQNHLTLPSVLPKSTTGVNNIHGMSPPQNQNTVAPEPAHISPPTNQVNMISTNSPVLPLGQTAPPSIQGQFGNLPMVGGVPGLPPPNMPEQLGNIPTMGDQKTLTKYAGIIWEHAHDWWIIRTPTKYPWSN